MRRGERGQVLVILAVAIFALLGAVALAVDLGYVWSVRHELQRSADAGALAGASAFKDTGQDSNDPPTRALAEARARDLSTRDLVAQSVLNDNEVSVSFPLTNLKRVRVDTTRTVNLFFARIFGRDNAAVGAFAVAEAFPVTEKVKCVVPWGIPIPWVDANNNGQYDAGESFSWPPPTAAECESKGSPTQWSYATHDIVGTRSERDNFLCQGSLQVMKIGDANNKMNPGNFFGMDLNNIVADCPDGHPNIGPGANFYSYLITHSCDCDFTVNINDPLPVLPTEPGNMVGPTISPVAPDAYYGDGAYLGNKPGWQDPNSLMNGDPGSTWVSDSGGGYPDSGSYSWFKDGEPAAGNWQDSSRVVRVPIYDPTGTIDGGIHTPGPGKTSFEPLGFVGFWIQDIQYFPPNNGTVVGRFITVGGWGGGGSDPGAAGTPVLSIRLVQ